MLNVVWLLFDWFFPCQLWGKLQKVSIKITWKRDVVRSCKDKNFFQILSVFHLWKALDVIYKKCTQFWGAWHSGNADPPCEQTNACENITFPILCMRAVKMPVTWNLVVIVVSKDCDHRRKKVWATETHPCCLFTNDNVYWSRLWKLVFAQWK